MGGCGCIGCCGGRLGVDRPPGSTGVVSLSSCLASLPRLLCAATDSWHSALLPLLLPAVFWRQLVHVGPFSCRFFNTAPTTLLCHVHSVGGVGGCLGPHAV